MKRQYRRQRQRDGVEEIPGGRYSGCFAPLPRSVDTPQAMPAMIIKATLKNGGVPMPGSSR